MSQNGKTHFKNLAAKSTSKRLLLVKRFTAQKMTFFINNFFSKCGQVRGFLWIWSHLAKESSMTKIIPCAVKPLEEYYW